MHSTEQNETGLHRSYVGGGEKRFYILKQLNILNVVKSSTGSTVKNSLKVLLKSTLKATPLETVSVP